LKEIPVSKRKPDGCNHPGRGSCYRDLGNPKWPLNNEQGSNAVNQRRQSGLCSRCVLPSRRFSRWITRKEKKPGLSVFAEVSTPAGCQLLSAGADSMWKKYVDAKSVVQLLRRPVEKVADKGTEQVLRMTITLSSPLAG